LYGTWSGYGGAVGSRVRVRVRAKRVGGRGRGRVGFALARHHGHVLFIVGSVLGEALLLVSVRAVHLVRVRVRVGVRVGIRVGSSGSVRVRVRFGVRVGGRIGVRGRARAGYG
jgi:hypothetical protein